MPRTPVNSQALEEERESIPSSREVQGSVMILDGEKLRIGKTDLRLFGIVPPQLSASFGPQSRAYLDALTGGQALSCRIRDRDRDERLLATCTTPNGHDVALELLRHGLAVAARGSIVGTELADAYIVAEQTAQSQKIGLWSLSTNAPAAAPAAVAAAPVAVAAPRPPDPPPAAEPEAKKTEEVKKTEPEPKKEEKAASRADSQIQAKIAADILSQQAEARIDDFPQRTDDAGFFERYQIIISGLLMLATALFIANALRAQRTRDRRDEIKALAAALRGELMAARSICFGRAKSITSEGEDRVAIWPRIRSTLYQAYVGRLGMLGAELARQIASIYGQSSDYTALYNPASTGIAHEVPKKQALETLLKHIDEVLPRLAEIERTGRIFGLTSLAPPSAPPPRAPRRKSPASYATFASMSLAESEVLGSRSSFSFNATGAVGTLSALWDTVRGFLQYSSGAEAPPPPPPLDPRVDAHVADYTAIIEADMERYQHIKSSEATNVAAQKRRR
jgi:endonuclease YncB( thermonuclease family)